MSDPHAMTLLAGHKGQGGIMHFMLVARQLSGVIDAISGRITRPFGLTPQDVLVLGWMAERPGISGTLMAQYIGRTRQSVQRSLERLEFREFVARYESCIRDRTSGWGLTEKGQELWAQLQRAYSVHEIRQAPRGIEMKELVAALEEVVAKLRRARERNTWTELIEIPKEESTPEWDL